MAILGAINVRYEEQTPESFTISNSFFEKLERLRVFLIGTQMNRRKINEVKADLPQDNSPFPQDDITFLMKILEENDTEEVWKTKPTYFLALFERLVEKIGEKEIQRACVANMIQAQGFKVTSIVESNDKSNKS